MRTLPHDNSLKFSNNLFDGQRKSSAGTCVTIPRTWNSQVSLGELVKTKGPWSVSCHLDMKEFSC